MPIPASELDFETRLRVLLMGPAKSGKEHPVTEPVLTLDGWRTMGDLHVGSAVVGSDGKPIRVTGVFPQGIKKIFKVTADDGTWALCGAEHLWHTTTRQELDRGKYERPRVSKDRSAPRPRVPTGKCGEGSVKTTAEIARTLDERHYLPALSGPVLFRKQPNALGLDPYYLGLLLGDGGLTGDSLHFTKNDQELRDAIASFATSVGDSATHYAYADQSPGVRITGGTTKAVLGMLGLLGHRSEAKFIPPEYLSASVEARLALLQGLCDTDGHCAETQCEYSTSSPRLRDGVAELARSLGGRVLVRSKETDCLPAWSLMISFPDGTCPFRLARKASGWRKPERVWRKRIVDVEAAGSAECVCIAVDATDHLYVTRNYLLTHNTTCAIATAPGPVRVLLCEDRTAVREAWRRTKNFDVEDIGGWKSIQTHVLQARKDAEEGLINTVVLDPISDLAERMLDEAFKETTTSNGERDGRRAYPLVTERLSHLVEQLVRIPCHVIVIAHHEKEEGQSLGGVPKEGAGIIPLLPGKSRRRFAAKFHDVVWFDYRNINGKMERAFVTGPEGAWGPGCRSLRNTKVLPANITKLIEAFAAQAEADASGEDVDAVESVGEDETPGKKEPAPTPKAPVRPVPKQVKPVNSRPVNGPRPVASATANRR